MAAVKRTPADSHTDRQQAGTEDKNSEIQEDTEEQLLTPDAEMSADPLDLSGTGTPGEGAGENSAIEAALAQFVTVLKQEFARERERERAALRAAFTEQVRKIEIEARKVVRERVIEARNREQKKIAEREKRINDLFRKLNLLARDIAHQKQVLKKSREEFDRKLLESDFIQTELRNIGHQMGEQVDSLGDSLLEEGFIEETMPERKVG